jgi:DNA-binding NarL/FixJ family response regulator
MLIHPYTLYRESLAQCLSQQPHLKVLGSVPSVSAMLAQWDACQPDVILIDAAVQDQERLSELTQLQNTLPHGKLLMLGVPTGAAEICAGIEAGAAGYVPYEATLQDLGASIRKVAAGEVICGSTVARALFTHIATAARCSAQRLHWDGIPLTLREQEILELLAAGRSNKEIMATLQVALTTVKNHVHNILRKLHCASRQEAAQYACHWHCAHGPDAATGSGYAPLFPLPRPVPRAQEAPRLRLVTDPASHRHTEAEMMPGNPP